MESRGAKTLLVALCLVSLSPVGEKKRPGLAWLFPRLLSQGYSLGRGLRRHPHLGLPHSLAPDPPLQEAVLNFGSRRGRWQVWAPGPAALISVCSSGKVYHEENRQQVTVDSGLSIREGLAGLSASKLKLSTRFW